MKIAKKRYILVPAFRVCGGGIWKQRNEGRRSKELQKKRVKKVEGCKGIKDTKLYLNKEE